MKRFVAALTGALVSTTVLTSGQVSAGVQDAVGEFFFKKKAMQVVENYTDKTVIKSITNLTNQLAAFNTAATKLKAEPTTANLKAAIVAWKESKAEFNKCQALMFGPAAYYDFHKQLAIWPVDKVLVDHALGEIRAGKMTIDAQTLRRKTASMRGLHAAQYLLFDNGQAKEIDKIGEVERNYLAALGEVMLWEGLDFKASWIGTEKLPAAERALLDKAGIAKRPAFAEEFAKPGKEGSRYVSLSIPLQELIQEAATVIDDMMPEIEELAASETTPSKNYWQSIDPYSDIANRLQGVENAYLGGVGNARGGASFSDLVAAKDEVLDTRIKASFAQVGKRLEAARQLKDGPKDNHALAVQVVVAESKKLALQLWTATPLVTADDSLEPFAAYLSKR